MSPARRYARFLVLAAVVVGALLGVGFLPTRRLAGSDALPAMVAGALISLTGAALAGWALVAVRATTPTMRMQLAMRAMVVRLVVVLALGVAMALSGLVARTPLLFWIAASYVALLPLEVKLALES